MPKPARVVELEMAADLPVSPVEWHGAANLMVAFIGFFLIAVMFGLGSGRVGRVRVETPNGALHVSYDSISRLQETTQLNVLLPGLASVNGQASLWIDHSFIEGYQVEAIYPEPLQVQSAGEWTLYTFGTATPGQSIEVSLHLRPLASGLYRGRVGWGQEPGLHLSQVILP